MLEEGQIEHSVSAWSAPTVLVTKKDGTTRFCVDYRWLNARTKKDAFPLPRIDDSLNSLSGQAWFSTLDLASGYWQVRLSEEAKPKTAFATHSGLFQFAVMPFGLCNAPATFERLMSQVMRGLHWKRCLVYIDDILVFGNDFESALHSLELVLNRVAEYGLRLKSTKCNLFRTSVPFLGHIVGRAGLECDPNKLSAVANWIPPPTTKGVREFLGFTAQIARPRWPNVGPPVAPPLGHRWQPPVGQRHFGQWANVGPTVACHCWATGGPTLGHRWPRRWATVGSHRWANVILASGPTLAQQWHVACQLGHRWATGGPPVGQHQCHRWAND